MDLHELDRSECSCEMCRAACRHMPGMLIPGDIDRIAECLDTTPSEDFIAKNFRASTGMKALCQGNTVVIPTIVPAQKPNGECVFYSNGKCTVHKASPFGCSHFRVCDNSEEGVRESGGRVRLAANAIANSVDYSLTWGFLHGKDLVAEPIEHRKSALSAEIRKIESRLPGVDECGSQGED